MYGSIDSETLLTNTGSMGHPLADRVREAAKLLTDVCVNGAILADETGFGKTKQCLLAATIHALLFAEKDPQGRQCYRPILLVCPPTLIRQWVAEIYYHWPFLRCVLSYEDNSLKNSLDITHIPQIAMREFPALEAMPQELRYLFDPTCISARQVIIVKSYITHKNRTGKVEVKEYPGIPFSPPRIDPTTGEEVFEKPPRKKLFGHQSLQSTFLFSLRTKRRR
jgi:hypothetical protein